LLAVAARAIVARMTARTILAAALLILVTGVAACEAKKEAKPAPPPPGTPVVMPGEAGSAAGPAPTATPLTPLAKDPGGAIGKPRWGVGLGGLEIDVARDVTADADGDAFVAGYFEGEATFGALGKRTSAGASDAFVAKIGKDGAPAWVRTFGAKREDVANAVAVDAKGNVAVAGNFLDDLAIDKLSARSTNSDDLFVLGLGPDGSAAWLWTAGGIGSDGANAIAAHPAGGWVVGGSFLDVAEIGPHKFKSLGGPDAFLAKLAATGEVEWALQLGGRYGDTVQRIAVDPAGSIYVLAQFADTASFGGEPLVAAGNAGVDIAVAKYDASGHHLWSKRFGNELEDGARGLAVDPAGNITFAGSFEKAIELGGKSYTSAGESDIFVVHLSTDGAFQWARVWGSPREDVGHGVAADAAGNAVITGWFQGAVDFGSGELTSAGNKDVFVTKLDATGALVWVQTFGDRDHDQGRAIAVDGQGQPVVTGIFRFRLADVTPPIESVHAAGDKAPKPDTFVLALAR